MASSETEYANGWDHVSASQLKLFIRCNRKWTWKYLIGKRPPGTEPMFFGSAFHHFAEMYVSGQWDKGQLVDIAEGRAIDREFREGRDDECDYDRQRQIKAAKLVMAGVDSGTLLTPEELDAQSLFVEVSTHKDCPAPLSMAGIPVHGYIDLGYIKGGMPHVIDHKTTSAWRWSKTAEELRQNVQLITYAEWLFRHAEAADAHEDFDRVIIGQNQFHKKQYDVREVRVELSRDHVADCYADLVGYVEEMKDIAADPAMAEIAPNWSACGDYGGCPFVDTCKAARYDGNEATTESGFAGLGEVEDKQLKGDNAMGLLNKLKSQKTKDDDETGNGFAGMGSDSSKPSGQGMPDGAGSKAEAAERQAEPPAPEPEPDIVVPFGDETVNCTERFDRPEAIAEKLTELEALCNERGIEPDLTIFSDGDLAKFNAEGLVRRLDNKDELQSQVTEQLDNPGIEPPEAPADEKPKSLDEMTLHEWDITDVDGIGKKGAEKIYEALEDGQNTPLQTFFEMDHTKLPGVGPKTAENIAPAMQGIKGFHADLPEGAGEAPNADDGGGSGGDRRADLFAGPSPLVKAKKAIVEAYIEGGDDGEFEARKRKAAKVRDWKRVDNPFVEDLERGFEDHLQEWVDQYNGEADDGAETASESAADTGALEAAKAAKADLDETHPPETPGATGTGGLTVLLVDCHPARFDREAVLLDELLAPAKDTVADQLGVPYYALPDYRKGEKALAGVVAANFDQFEGKVLVARSDTDYSKSVLEVLRARADLVIEG